MSSGHGEIPDRQYSLRAALRQMGCNSPTDGKVRMKEDMTRVCLDVSLRRGIFLNPNHILQEEYEKPEHIKSKTSP